MFNSVALNVVISLVFIYLLYSLLATTINEGIAAVFNLRAKKLQLAISRMLDDGVMHHENMWTMMGEFFTKTWKNIKSYAGLLTFKKRSKLKAAMTLMELFYDHPGIKYLGENKISNKPSYISSEFFSKALMDVLVKKANSPSDPKLKQVIAGIASLSNSNETKAFIESLLADANNDLEKFRASLEHWFDETMNRTSGWYKKQSQKITFAIGLVLAISFNVDTISIVKQLSVNPDAAKNLSDVAAKYVETHKDSSGHLDSADRVTAEALFNSAKSQVDGDINDANSIIGLGWTIPYRVNGCIEVKRPNNSGTESKKCVQCELKSDSLAKIKNVKHPLKTDSVAASEIKKMHKMHIKRCIQVNTRIDSITCVKCLEKVKEDWAFGINPYYNRDNHKINGVGKVRYVICMAWSGRKLIGYLLTALAISFGAPFWFDLLNKLIQIRGAGKKPEEEEKKEGAPKQPDVKRVG